MYTLIVIILSAATGLGGMAIGGFESEETCEKAGHEILGHIEKMNKHVRTMFTCAPLSGTK